MGVPLKEKAELVAYQLIGVAQVWHTQWLIERLGNDRVGCEELKYVFLDSVFLLELREAKLTEFINLRPRGMSMRENAPCSLNTLIMLLH